MATAPQVRDLNATIEQLRQANQSQYDLLNQDEAGLATTMQTNEAALDAKKDAEFKGITAQASDRGALFSGFSPDAQATYLGETYLPALANMRAAIEQQRRQIQGQRADLGTNTFNQALGLVESDKQMANQWNMQEVQREFQAAQAELDRSFQREQGETQRQWEERMQQAKMNFEAAENKLNRAATASNARASRSSSAPKAPSQAQYLSALFTASNEDGQNIYATQPRYTENVVIPQFAANFGLSYEDAQRKVYDYRKQYYGS